MPQMPQNPKEPKEMPQMPQKPKEPKEMPQMPQNQRKLDLRNGVRRVNSGGYIGGPLFFGKTLGNEIER